MDASSDQTDKSAEHVIPQMVVTSADDEVEAFQTTTETYPVPDVSSEISSTGGVSQEATKDVHTTETVHQQVTNVGNPKESALEDVSSKVEVASEEPVVHTAVQRPLIIESEKCVSPSPSVESNFQSLSESPLPQAVPLTTMQRPLVFEGSSPQAENFVLPPEYPELPSQELCPSDQEAIPGDILMEDEINLNAGIPSSATDSKPKSSSFSWMPNFPKLHAHGKEPKDANLTKKDETHVDNQNIQDSELSPGKKDGLQNVKKFFDNLLHDTPSDNKSDNKDKSKVQSEVQEDLDTHAKKVPKDEKQSYYKKIFGSSKSEVDSETKVPKQSEYHQETETAPKEPHKDSKYNIKKMFDSFKHDDKKDSPKKSSDSTQADIKTDVPNAAIASQSIQNASESVPKEQSKDSKYNLKKMLDSFKHDVVDKKDSSKKSSEVAPADIKSDLPKVTVTSQIQSETENVPKEQPKDSKYNIKKMFDSFKHDGDKKDTPPQKDTEVSPDKIKSKVPKVKITSETDIPNEAETVSKDQSKDSKYNIKKMFDSLKHDFVDKKDSPQKESTISQGEIKPDSIKTEKDSKSGIKKFFDSLKHDGGNVDEVTTTKVSEKTPVLSEDHKVLGSESKNMKSTKSDDHFCKDVLEFELPELTISSFPSDPIPVNENKVQSTTSKLKDSDKAKPKESQHGVKKFFSAFKQEGPGTSKGESGKFHVTFMERENSLKRSHSFKDSILLKDTQPPDESTKKSKDNLQGVKKYFSSLKQNQSEENIKDLDKRKSNEIKRSQSCRETAAEKEGFHIKSFFDSFSHKSTSKASSQSPATRVNRSEEHIYDTVGKPDPKKYPADDLKLTTKKTVAKSKDDQSGMKKLFDSFIHKDQSSKPKAKGGEGEKEQDKVPPLTITSSVAETERTLCKENSESKTKVKIDPTIAKTSDQLNKKSVPTIVTPPSETQTKPKIATKPPSIQVSSTSSPTDGKTSVFNTISDNFMAIKDKVLHSKDSKKSEVELKDEISAEYDLQQAASKNQFQPSTSGTYTPIKDASFIDINISHEAEDKKSSSLVSSQNKPVTNATVPQDAAVQQSLISDSKKPPKPIVKRPTVSPGTPETLYDTCCIRLAVLLGKKAIEIVSDQTKSPPKKPPKPSAEAIAKARAAVVSKRLREIQYKGQSIGENIPVGYDGIRFADDETESSCDYKDVDNFDYIMDYELINRYKCDSKLDTFSDPSTCSGISSYYTADTVTLKDETFSDAPLETISLNDDDSCHFQIAQNANEIQTWPSSKKSKNGKERVKSEFNLKEQRSVSQVGPKLTSNIKSSKKKIPPPIPPKPILSPKPTSPSNRISTPTPSTTGSTSQCINGLSLSPRLQSKFPKDTVVTKHRPLVVAGFKGTEFTSLQAKPKDSHGKQPKDRKFDTVLKNESLKKVTTISFLEHKPLQSSKSSPSQLIGPQSANQLSTPKKFSPQRPPLPNLKQSDKLKSNATAPPVPEKPKRESRMAASQVSEEKRTVSPPRPPPPVINKISVPPPRPPPPVPKLKPLDKPSVYENSENQPESKDDSKSYENTTEHTFITPQEEETHPLTHELNLSTNVDDKSEISPSEVTSTMEDSIHLEEKSSTVGISQNEPSIETYYSAEDISTSIGEKRPLSISPDLSFVSDDVVIPQSTPKPPPRSRRIRSRTVEITHTEKVDTNLRRSQSLSDIDVQKRTSHLNVSGPTEKSDLKNLYTSVNKDGKRTVLNGANSLSLEKVSSRPLPAPPPPPRKFRSLDRKPKEKQTKKDAVKADQFVLEAGSSDFSIKPPERKRKSDKLRFHSLSTERKKHESRVDSGVESPKMPRSNSAPMRPERRYRHEDTEYDENANVSFPTVAEVHHSAVILDECGNEILESSSNSNIPVQDAVDSERARSHSERITPHPRLRKGKNPKTKSHSSWYDETLPSEDSWELVDYDPSFGNPKDSKSKLSTGMMPTRRRSDPSGSRTKPTSKFYVNVDIGDIGLPHSDKETSPLHIDCSEKSVQTSLETLSQGLVSHDDEISVSSENTDNLLNIVKTLQSELKVTLNRHKSLDDDDNDSSNIDNDSSNIGTDSEKLDVNPTAFLKTPSIQSSTSDLWPLSSSDESDGEVAHDGPVSLSDIALARKKKKIFYIAQEIMTSEEVFVDTLKLLNVDFKAAVEAASKQRGAPVIPDEVLGQMLNHLPQLQHLNENLLMELKDRIDNWDKTEKIADVIVKMGPFLKLYSWFIHDFESNLSLMEESKRKYPLFAQVVKEFEASARCKRLSLNHYMLKPIQRIPQYRLLLQEYLHHLSEECLDYQDTVTALQIVSEVANHANESMKHGDNAQKLISIQNSIIGHNEIIKPGRLFLKEGVLMKLSRKEMQPRWFVLFNDLLLYLTPVQQGLYRINHKLSLTKMKVAIPIQQDYQNEFSIISETRSFSLAARSQEERQEWIVALTKAIEENMAKRRTFTPSVMDKNSEEDSEFVLGKKAPVWIPDARVTMCQLCTSEFTVTFRRHHCRACGKVICSICSGNRIPLHYLKGHKAKRVCDECYAQLGPDTRGSPENAETDSDNQQIAVKPHLRTDNRYVKKVKRNLPSVLKEVCANDQGSTISGYLQKRLGKSWKKEWFVVKDKVLYEYKASEDVAALRSTPLLGYQIESFSEAYENVNPSLLFQLTHPGQAPIIFHADSVGSTERWIAALKEASVLE